MVTNERNDPAAAGLQRLVAAGVAAQDEMDAVRSLARGQIVAGRQGVTAEGQGLEGGSFLVGQSARAFELLQEGVSTHAGFSLCDSANAGSGRR